MSLINRQNIHICIEVFVISLITIFFTVRINKQNTEIHELRMQNEIQQEFINKHEIVTQQLVNTLKLMNEKILTLEKQNQQLLNSKDMNVISIPFNIPTSMINTNIENNEEISKVEEISNEDDNTDMISTISYYTNTNTTISPTPVFEEVNLDDELEEELKDLLE